MGKVDTNVIFKTRFHFLLNCTIYDVNSIETTTHHELGWKKTRIDFPSLTGIRSIFNIL